MELKNELIHQKLYDSACKMIEAWGKPKKYVNVKFKTNEGIRDDDGKNESSKAWIIYIEVRWRT